MQLSEYGAAEHRKVQLALTSGAWCLTCKLHVGRRAVAAAAAGRGRHHGQWHICRRQARERTGNLPLASAHEAVHMVELQLAVPAAQRALQMALPCVPDQTTLLSTPQDKRQQGGARHTCGADCRCTEPGAGVKKGVAAASPPPHVSECSGLAASCHCSACIRYAYELKLPEPKSMASQILWDS